MEEMSTDAKSAPFEIGEDAKRRADTIGVEVVASGDIGNYCYRRERKFSGTARKIQKSPKQIRKSKQLFSCESVKKNWEKNVNQYQCRNVKRPLKDAKNCS